MDEHLSDYHLVQDAVLTTVRLSIAVEPEVWSWYTTLTLVELAAELVRLAKGVKLKRYPKKKLGLKMPPPPKSRKRGQPHISAAKTLAKARQR